jgi:hypothetical protein|tara:strand:+ start:12801 stop:18023 length:5223 start_codon:yes stop_codon:yes gene_type:complete
MANHIPLAAIPDAGRPTKLAAGALSVCLLLLVAWFFLRVFEPAERIPPITPYEGYDRAPMQAAVTPESVGDIQYDITGLGSRYLGQPGFYAVEDFIRETYRAAGLDVYEQENWSAAPKTLRRDIALADGTAMPDVEIFPLLPGQAQPMVTSDDGVVGRLIPMTRETMRNGASLKGAIGLVSMDYAENAGTNWRAYAQLGLAAIVLYHRDGLGSVPWQVLGGTGGMVPSVPVNFVRVVATKEILDYVGREVRLTVKTRWERTRNTTIIGVLRAKGGASRALLVTGHYDACSYLPDRAPGVLQALMPATQLALLRGLLPYRDTIRRDVLFVSTGAEVMGNDGLNELIATLNTNTAKSPDNPLLKALGITTDSAYDGTNAHSARLEPIIEREETNDISLAHLDPILEGLEEPQFLRDRDFAESIMAQWNESTLEYFEEQFTYVLNTLVFETSEGKLQANVLLEREDMARGRADPLALKASPSFEAYLAATKRFNQTMAAAGFSVGNLIELKQEFIADYEVRNRLIERFEELSAYHERIRERVVQDKALVDLFSPYAEVVVIEPKLLPASFPGSGKEILSFSPGQILNLESPSAVFLSLLSASKKRLRLDDMVETPPLVSDQTQMVSFTQMSWMAPSQAPSMWTDFGYPAFTVLNFSRQQSFSQYAAAVELPFMRDLESIRGSLAVVGEAVLSLAHGIAKFPSTKPRWEPNDFGGRVLVAGVGKASVPNYPLKDAIVTTYPFPGRGSFARWGFYDHLLEFTDPYDEFSLPNTSTNFVNWWLYYTQFGFNPFAVGHGADGLISHVTDQGEEGQSLYKSVGLTIADAEKWKEITMVVFRGTGVTMLDMTNPQTMKSYTGVELLSQESLTPLRKRSLVVDSAVQTTFVQPDERFYVTLKAGAADNELVQETRAFMLGNSDSYVVDPEKAIDGPGYLAADNPTMVAEPTAVARSMIQVNGRRLDLQNEFGMADDRTRDYHEKSMIRDAEARRDGLERLDARRIAGEAVTYATLNHPVIRESVTEAVLGILWYLALLVPFTFFFEKLVFGFSDVRKQVSTQAIIFISVFGLLRVLHPAFEMVRSSTMILLGFIIILISAGVALLFAGKFKENLEAISQKRGQVTAAKINSAGVLGTAFMLGLTNMHRRKVRTGLTCATLVLMTFVMICFTAVHTEVVDENTATGRSPYQGVLVKRERFGPIFTVSALRDRYGDRYEVCARRMLLGSLDQEQQAFNPALEIVHRRGDRAYKVDFGSIVQFAACEPLRDQIEFVSKYRWFTKAQEYDSDIMPVYLPDRMARELGVSISAVNAAIESNDAVEVIINGRRCNVQGIFDSRVFDNLHDLDGKDLLPFDVEAMKNVMMPEDANYTILAHDDDPRIPAARIVIAPLRDSTRITAKQGLWRTVSVAISMSGESYRDVKDTIDTYLEASAEPVHYGLGDIAYQGKRTREVTMAGLMQMLIPLIIAALTVLNTMKGSVYERRDEIFVYNAVGIAPKYVSFMFFAEAAVYVVIGSVLGYILSQGTGRILIELSQSSLGVNTDFTGGLSMAFTSQMTVYASIAIAVSVFASTYFPARAAMEIAAPAEDSGWDLPETDGDELSFHLPFTFTSRDRIAVLCFFERYLEDHGKGGGGRFFADPPQIGVSSERDPLAGDAPVPCLEATVWLKPFDLGVSQSMEVSLPTDPETREFIATVTLARLSGTHSAWMHLNKSFVQIVRQQFLHWRAVSADQREQMFHEAKDRLTTSVDMA